MIQINIEDYVKIIQRSLEDKGIAIVQYGIKKEIRKCGFIDILITAIREVEVKPGLIHKQKTETVYFANSDDFNEKTNRLVLAIEKNWREEPSRYTLFGPHAIPPITISQNKFIRLIQKKLRRKGIYVFRFTIRKYCKNIPTTTYLRKTGWKEFFVFEDSETLRETTKEIIQKIEESKK